MMKSLALAAFALALSGCYASGEYPVDDPSSLEERTPVEAQAPAPAEDSDEEARDPAALALRAGGTDITVVRVEEDGITGPNVSIGRYLEDDAPVLRGTMGDKVVELQIGRDRITGIVGSARVDLSIAYDRTGLDVRGLLPGHLSRFRIDGDVLDGQIGWCSYNLKRNATGFSGRRRCSGAPSFFAIEVPDTLAAWTDAETVAAFALLL